MQTELETDSSSSGISFLGVNEWGQESGNSAIPPITDMPWLQDVDRDGDSRSDLWAAWGIAYRDIAILDAENQIVTTFNVTTNDLSDATNFSALKSQILAAKGGGAESNSASLWPSGWAYSEWPYLYDFGNARWYYFDESEDSSSWHSAVGSGSWSELNSVGGWTYFLESGDYFYATQDSAWHYFNDGNLQWVNDLSSGVWYEFGL